MALCAAVGAAAEHIKGADRQLTPFSPLVRELQDKPAPPNWDEVEVLATLMAYAHDVETAGGLGRLVEREALLEVLGEPLPPRAAKVSLVVDEMARARKAVEELRLRVLERPVRAEPIVAHDESLTPKQHGERYRHEGGSVWARDDGGTQRVIGVRVSNPGDRKILKGSFELELGTARDALRFLCHYRLLEPRESRAVLCYGDRFKPFDKLAEAIRSAASGFTPSAQHFEVVYELRGNPFTVKPGETRYGSEHLEYERRAMAMIQQQGCGARGACGAAVAETFENPFLLGIVLGIVAGLVLLLLQAAFGSRAAGVATTLMAGIVLFLMVGGVVAAFLFGAKGHWVYALLFAGAAAGHIGELVMGGLLGLVGVIAFVLSIGRLRRRLRGA